MNATRTVTCRNCGREVDEHDAVLVCVARETHDSPAEYEAQCEDCAGPEDDPDPDRMHDEIACGDRELPVWWR